jgi:beta-lactamase regulating signal transducer with metallopeptidase domain
VKNVNISNLNEIIQKHYKYQNETFAIEANQDEIAFGVGKVKKIEGVDMIQNSQNVRKMFKVVEGTRSFPLSWLMKQSSFLVESFNKFIMECEQHGFTDYFYKSQFVDVPYSPDKPDPQILTLDILSAGLIVWIVSVLIACIVFGCEHIVAFFNRRKMKQNSIERNKKLFRKNSRQKIMKKQIVSNTNYNIKKLKK